MDRMRAERAQLKMTQEELAKELKVTRSTISAWERGDGIIPVSALIQMAALFNCSADWLLGLSESRK
mgnify:CR=1 FL=1